jgi:hypothetical protein
MPYPNHSCLRTTRWALAAASALLLFSHGGVARADFLFTFAGLGTNSSGGSGDNSNTTAVQNYMQGVLGAAGHVTVTGAFASSSYNGDGHVAGPGNGSKSATLATWDFTHQQLLTTPKPFIMNNQNNDPTNSASQSIVMTFTNIKITGVSFNYEIFPDASGTSTNPPDFTFGTNTNASIFTVVGVVPGTTTGTDNANGTLLQSWSHSPNSGPSGKETSPQLIGSYSNLNLGAGVTQLSFDDWPAHIAINNLEIYTDPLATPEPASFILLAIGGLAGLPFLRRHLKAPAAV